MLKSLIKKQFRELFRSYFVSTKTGKARSKFGSIAMFGLFAFLMLFLCFIFFGMGTLVAPDLMKMGYGWLFYAFMGIVSIALGTFGSVFNTFATLYLAKDNDFLLSMPIPPRKIFAARLTVVYALSALYCGLVWLPTLVCGQLFDEIKIRALIFGILLYPFIALFVTTLSCLLGWVVACVSKKVKSKSFVTVAISLVFFGVYYFVCMRMTSLIQSFLRHADVVGNKIKVWGNLLYQLGQGAGGSISSMLLFCGIVLVLFAVCRLLIDRNFAKILTRSQAQAKTMKKTAPVKSKSMQSALLHREAKRFTASATYMLNSALGIIFMPVLAAAAVIKRATLLEYLPILNNEFPGFTDFLPVLVFFVFGSVIAINAISTPSVSLEGKNIWILQTMPIPGAQILQAKVQLHALINGIPAVLCALVLSLSLGFEWETTIPLLGLLWVYCSFTGALGLIIGLKRPNLHWTNEAIPIKQNLNTLLAYLASWACVILMSGGFYLLQDKIDAYLYLLGAMIVLALPTRLLNRWIGDKGARIFNSLS